jgi:site-specific DNA-methyltransferase (adenine-specific)
MKSAAGPALVDSYPEHFEFGAAEYVADPSATSVNHLAFSDKPKGVYLYEGNCLEVMDAILSRHPDGIFDMIFADPPYFLSNGGITCQNGRMVKVDKGEWDKSRGPEMNHAFNREWLSRCQRLLKPDGTLWVSGTMHAIYSIGFAMQQLEFKLLNDIAWEKPNPPPNLACRYFTHSTETIIWAAKNAKSKHVFNYAEMKRENSGKQMKSVWRILPPGRDEKLFGKHPTQKPVAIVERCIRASTRPLGFVFDPFSGSSTTGIAAIQEGRRFCGVEAERSFVELSISRLTSTLKSVNV